MKKGATTPKRMDILGNSIIALRNEKGSYNLDSVNTELCSIIALRNEKGSYNITT